MFLALGNDDGGGGEPAPPPSPAGSVAAPTVSVPPSPPAPDPSMSGDPLTRLDTRSGDPEPLTLDEVFPEKKFDVDGTGYTRAARTEDENCTAAVEGSGLSSAIQSGGCTQVLRASYVSGDVISTVGIVNLENAEAVETAFEAAQGTENYITPLPGSGRASDLGQGRALGAQLSRGHYLVLSWVQYADGRNPSGTEDKKLTRHDEEVFEHTILTALSYRMLTGQPLNP